MATGGLFLAKPKDSSKTSAHQTSVQGDAAIAMAALLLLELSPVKLSIFCFEYSIALSNKFHCVYVGTLVSRT